MREGRGGRGRIGMDKALIFFSKSASMLVIKLNTISSTQSLCTVVKMLMKDEANIVTMFHSQAHIC